MRFASPGTFLFASVDPQRKMAMQYLCTDLTATQLAGFLFGVWLIYAAQLGLRRLYFSPIAHIPGPRLAALTQYYEFYYDIILGGQYTFKIIELHRRYGPVIRINPWEVHVGDPDFFPELYTGPGRLREKWPFYAKQVRPCNVWETSSWLIHIAVWITR